jgi:broad specificity phosphatase PhoE
MLLPVLFATSLHAGEPAKLTTVILVRHAERLDTSTDSPLSEAGEARAKKLATVLAVADVSAIYTTPYKRTETTVAPLAAARNLTPVRMMNAKSYVEDVVDAIRTKHAGNTVVVVGHSNTTPNVIKALGIPNPPAIPDSQYDDLFIVTIGNGVTPALVKLKY